MDTDLLTKHIDWSNHATYKDLSRLFMAYAEGLRNADVTSGANGFADGYVKRGILERLEDFAKVFYASEQWLIVREKRNYTPGQGKVNNQTMKDSQ